MQNIISQFHIQIRSELESMTREPAVRATLIVLPEKAEVPVKGVRQRGKYIILLGALYRLD